MVSGGRSVLGVSTIIVESACDLEKWNKNARCPLRKQAGGYFRIGLL